MSKNALLGIVAVVVIAGGVYWYLNQPQTQTAEEQTVGIANPASTNCVALGGTLEIVDEAGGQVGYCHMKDGRVCEEWGLFRDGSCNAPK